MSLDVDLQPLWDGINQFFPIFFGAFAIIGGIGISIQLSMFLIDKIKDAFK